MPTIIIPHRDPNKAGATEHVDAIIKSLRSKMADSDIIIEDAIANSYEGTHAVDISDKIAQIKAKYGADAEFIVVTGDYGADPHLAKEGEALKSVATTFKQILGKNTKVVLSSYTAESQTILGALRRGEIDQLAVPEHAVRPDVLESELAKQVIRSNRDKLVLMTAVPHVMTQESLTSKRSEWNVAAENGKVKPIPTISADREMVAIMIPGDVEDAGGRPKLFTKQDAVKLAAAIAEQIKSGLREGQEMPVIMVSNGPRTGKYNEELFNSPDFLANNPAFQNIRRMDDVAHNPVTEAFVMELCQHFPEGSIILGCIEKGKVPPQGFLAFYDALNQHAINGGRAIYYVDGVSTTMMAQAANILHPAVQIVACDTPAKNRTHVAGVEDLYRKGQVHRLALDERQSYSLRQNPILRSAETRFDDASVVASKVVELSLGRDRNAAVGKNF